MRNEKVTAVDWLLGLVLGLIAFAMLYPVWWVIMTSLSDPVWL